MEPRHLFFIVEELKGALTRGYQLHVLGYTLHALLKSLINSGFLTIGSIDYCLNSILEVLQHSLFFFFLKKLLLIISIQDTI